MSGVVKRGCAAALLAQGCFTQAASAQSVAPITPVASLDDLQEEAPLLGTQKAPLAASGAHVSLDAANIIGGMTEAFLGSNKVSDRERSCLSSGASTLAAAVTQSCRDAVSAFHSAQAGLQQSAVALPPAYKSAVAFPQSANMTLPQQQVAGAFPYYTGATATVPPAGMTGGEETVITLEFAARFAGILELEQQLAKECLQADAVKTMQSVAEHMSNATYMGGRLIANGVDILTELTDATSAFDA